MYSMGVSTSHPFALQKAKKRGTSGLRLRGLTATTLFW
jgi:hypothetical protein